MSAFASLRRPVFTAAVAAAGLALAGSAGSAQAQTNPYCQYGPYYNPALCPVYPPASYSYDAYSYSTPYAYDYSSSYDPYAYNAYDYAPYDYGYYDYGYGYPTVALGFGFGGGDFHRRDFRRGERFSGGSRFSGGFSRGGERFSGGGVPNAGRNPGVE